MAINSNLAGIWVMIGIACVAISCGLILSADIPLPASNEYRLDAVEVWEEGDSQYLALMGTGRYPMTTLSLSDGYSDIELIWAPNTITGDKEIMKLTTPLDLGKKWYVVYKDNIYRADILSY